MKLGRISVLVGAVVAATSILASTSPAHALTWTLNNVTFTDGETATGSFDYNGGLFSNVGISVQKGATQFATFNTSNVVTTDGGGNQSSANNLWVALGSGAGSKEARFSILSGTFGDTATPSFNLSTNPTWAVGGTYYGLSQTSKTFLASGTISSTSVPFDIPGGATIPALGGLLALGTMRKARKSLASKTCTANPVTAMVS